MTQPLHPSQSTLRPADPPDPWRSAFAALISQGRRWKWAIAGCGLAFAVAGAGLKAYLPTTYTATAQLLFDPRGLKVFNNDLTSGLHDANAAINFVESQMGVIQSERVLSRVMDSECAASRKALKSDADGRASGPVLAFTRLCPGVGANGDWAKTLQALRRALSVKRAERSFVVDVSATGPTPALAAHLASAVVTAYVNEENATRTDAASKLTGDLGGRLEALRLSLQESEAKAEHYRRDKNLIRLGDRLLVEQRLTAATAALNETQARIDRASARVKQLDAAPRTASALGALGAEADTRALLVLAERRNAILVELAPLAARLGERHPALMEARSRLAETDKSIGVEMTAIRNAARADLARARGEHASIEKTVNELSAKVTQARQSEIELRTLEQAVDANRKLLESFETRSREAGEFGRIDSGNLRVVSVARAPETQRLAPRLILWGGVGLVLGLILAAAAVALSALLAIAKPVAPLRHRGLPEGAVYMGPRPVVRYANDAHPSDRYA